MPRRLLFALLILVAAPLVLLGWMSASAYQQQRKAAREQLVFFYQSRLDDHDRSLKNVFKRYERELEQQLTQSSNTLATLRRLDREHPIVRQTMFVNDHGILIYPPKPGGGSAEESSLYASIPAITDSKPDLSDDPLASDSSSWISKRKSPPTLRKGRWQVWYMDEGLQLIYWLPRSDGSSVGILLERARWVSDLTVALPNSGRLRRKDATSRRPGFTALVDESKRFVYRWGDNAGPGIEPLAARSLSSPLSSWQLQYHSHDPLPNSASIPLVTSLTGIGVLLLTLGAYVLTGVQRQMRTARSRVSFASQVSHELRTPLTNIRLYAELAESDLQKLPGSTVRDSIERRLLVIDTESRRLGRLVSGVLEMIREDRKSQKPRVVIATPDQVIQHTLTQFSPSFANAGLTVQLCLDASSPVGMDEDIFEMILVNLLSNVEKYASEGEHVTVSSTIGGDQLVVRVKDQGPGIPWRKRRNIFRAFTRLDDSISAPSGTGIGLTIARRLARRHGGELRLLKSEVDTNTNAETLHEEQGACFELRLPIELSLSDPKEES